MVGVQSRRTVDREGVTLKADDETSASSQTLEQAVPNQHQVEYRETVSARGHDRDARPDRPSVRWKALEIRGRAVGWQGRHHLGALSRRVGQGTGGAPDIDPPGQFETARAALSDFVRDFASIRRTSTHPNEIRGTKLR